MRIDEFHVAHFGPIRYDKPFVLSDFTLFWGKNEQGKTLTIDALVKLLLGKEAKRFVRIERVDDKPSGYVVVTVNSERYKLPEKGLLTDVCGLTEAECRNVFIVRASDLSIGRDEKEPEADFYAAVTDRITGMETRRISRVKDAVLSVARVTRTGRFRDIQDEGLKSRFETALAMTEEIDRLSADTQAEGLDTLEQEAVGEDEAIRRVGDELSALEDARKRKQYETGFAATERLREALGAAGRLERYRDEDERAWGDAEREIGRVTAEIGRLREQADKKKARLSEIINEIRKKEGDFQALENRKRKVDEDVRPRLVDYEKRLGRNAENSQKKGYYTLVSAVSAAVFCASLISVILRPHPLFTVLSAAALGATVVCITILSRIIVGRSRLERDFQEVRLDLARLELAGKSVPETLAAVQRFNEHYKKRFDEINGLRQDRSVLEREIADIVSRAVPEQERAVEAGRRAVADIQRNSGCKTIEDLAERLASRRDTDSVVARQVAILTGMFEKGTGNIKEDVELWRGKISELSSYREAAPGVEFTEQTYKEKQDEKRAAEQRLGQISSRLADFKKRLEQVERKANAVLATADDYIHCDTSSDLVSIAERLSAFISEHEANRSAALTAVGIFEQIEREEKGRVSLLFDEEGGVSGYFSTITGGLYDAVSFDPVGGVVSVRKGGGETLSADKLSSGAYDQLYLAVRLALGRRIAPDGAGFFIMDDPFIRSDPDRLARQMAMLGDIARKGWQIVYFSSKGEVKEALAKEIKKGAVTLIDI
ncbi:MAG: hypothetical protein JW765_11505 [Deltaproteobacteria bacterium]|nr:hypothetical protein [Candidatus Zymogenaceae bacterium]